MLIGKAGASGGRYRPDGSVITFADVGRVSDAEVLPRTPEGAEMAAAYALAAEQYKAFT